MISDLPSYDMFVPQQVPLWKNFDDVISCDLWFRPGLGKIDCNRYSIAIFLTFFQSNTPDPLLFGMSIEYAVFFSFFQVKTIFDFFFRVAK